MLMDDQVAKAKSECEKFLGMLFHSKAEETAALEGVLEATKKVLAAANLTTGMAKHESVALEVYRAHRDASEICQVVKISLTQNGKMVKEDFITCCPDLCTVLARQAYNVEPKDVVQSELNVKRLVQNIRAFLDDPSSSLTNLSSSVKN